MISERTVSRLSLYRRLLSNLEASGTMNIFSHELAHLAGVTAAQVRRDLMATGCTGSPIRGYSIPDLIDGISRVLDSQHPEKVALVGVGNLGRAILAYFAGRRPNLAIVATFDNDPTKVGRVIHGCRCYPISKMAEVVREMNIGVAILTVPAKAASEVAATLASAGVRGVLNFAPVRLEVPAHTYVEDVDLGVSLEKVAYFSRRGPAMKET